MLSIFKHKETPLEVRIWGTKPNLFFEAKLKDVPVMEMRCLKRENDILISDIVPCPDGANYRYNKGYGSRLMEELLKYAKDKNILHISGNLSKEDLNHKERLHHFYEKFGFVITEYDSPKGNYYGEINKLIEV